MELLVLGLAHKFVNNIKQIIYAHPNSSSLMKAFIYGTI